MMFLCGASLLYASPLALMKWLVMRFNGWIKRSSKTFTQHMLEFQSCIGLIDGIFIKICKPWYNLVFWSWFNEQKNMYYMNNMVINYCGFFIYLDLGYLCSFHNVNIMCGLSCTKIVANFLYTQMNTLSTCLVTQVF